MMHLLRLGFPLQSAEVHMIFENLSQITCGLKTNTNKQTKEWMHCIEFTPNLNQLFSSLFS